MSLIVGVPAAVPMPAESSRAVFLSYAREDTDAVRRIADALRAFDVEVWFDQAELRGGDAWDRKIREQIATCALFVPVISAATQERLEGYFRLEWKLAAQRTHTMAEEKPFLLPVVIDPTRDAEAKVPAEFKVVQWTRLPGGEPNTAFSTRVKTLLGNSPGPVAGAALRPGSASACVESGHKAPPATMPRTRWMVPAILGLAALVAFALWPPWKAPAPPASVASPIASSPSPAAAPTSTSVAVLAFENMSPDKDTEYFSDGVSEEILNALANNPGLRVAARTSSFSFKGRKTDIAEIGRVLNVARIIEGSVRKAGNRVRITVQLINAADGYHVWSEAFDRELTDIFAVQAEIAAKVAQKLGGHATVVASSAAPTKNLAAYDFYLRGRALQVQPDAKAMLEAGRLYGEALRLDPGYALAWARLAQTFARQRVGGYDRSEATAAKSRECAAAALRLDPNLPEAHLVAAMVRLVADFDYDAAERELNEAGRLRPNDPEALIVRAQLEDMRGRWSSGLVKLARRAEELDPQNADSFLRLGQNLSHAGQFFEADRLFRRSRALSQDVDAPARFLANNYVAWTGDLRGALEILDAVPEALRADSPLYFSDRGTLRARLGDTAGAIADFERARSGTNPASGPRTWRIRAIYRLARLEAKLGHAERARKLCMEAAAGFRQIDEDFPDIVRTPFELARVQAQLGDRPAALAAIAESEQRAARDRNAVQLAFVRMGKADVQAILGDAAAAIAELRAVHEMGWSFGYTLRVDLEWEALRGDPKFQQLMKEAEARADAQPRPKK